MNENPKTIKKLSKVGEGTAVFVTQEIKKLNWKQGDYVSVEILGEGKDSKIVMKRIAL